MRTEFKRFDRELKSLILGALTLLWLLPYVRWEPAPVDYLAWLLGGYLLWQRRRRLWTQFPISARIAVGIFGLAHLSALWAADLGRAAWYTLATLEMVVLLVIFWAVRLELTHVASNGSSGWSRTWGYLAWMYVGSAALAAALGAAAFFRLIPEELFLYGLDPGRVRALFKDPNVFGVFLVPAVLFVWASALSQEPKGKGARPLLDSGLAGLLTLGVLLSGSRTAWGGYALGLGLLLLSLWKEYGLQEVLHRGWGVALGTVLALGLLAHPQIWSLKTERAAVLQPYDYDRLDAWERALLPEELNVLRILLGVGPGQSEIVLNYATHNLYLRVWYELGAVGLLGLGILLWVTARRLLEGLRSGHGERRLEAKALGAALVATLAMSFFIDSLHWRHLFILLGWALADPGAPDHTRGRERPDVREAETVAARDPL